MTKKVITLSLSDLKDLGIIPRQGGFASGKLPRKSKRKRRSKRRKLYIDAKTGAVIGGPKADSSHMQGYTNIMPNPMPFNNTSNLNTEIQQANLESIRNKNLAITNGTPDRFDKDIVDRSFTRLMLPYIERQSEETNKIKGVLNSGIADYYDFKEQYQNDRPNTRVEELLNYDDNAGIVDPTLGDDDFVGGGLNMNYDTEARYAKEDPQIDIQSDINEERFNPMLPMDEEDEPVVIRRGRQRQGKEKQKDRKTIFGLVKNAMFSGGKDEKIAPFANDDFETSNPIADIPEISQSSVLDRTPKSALKSPVPSQAPASAMTSATKTPEEIKASKALVTNNQTNRVPKGLTVKEAKELYKYYGGENEYVDSMKNINAIWKHIREQKQISDAKPKKKRNTDNNI
jgi:hypothetical protein